MTSVARVMLLSGWIHIKQSAIQPGTIGIILMQPFFFALIAMYVLRHRPDFDGTFLVVGVGLTGLWSSIVWVGGGIVSGERWLGTLEVLEGAAASLFAIFGGKMLANVVVALISLLPGYLVGPWFFGYSISLNNPAAFVVSICFTLFAFWSMALLFAPIFVLSPHVGNVLTATEYPIYVVSGFLVPIAFMPLWLHPLSFALPPFWAATALHGTSWGALGAADLLAVWGMLLSISILIPCTARWLFAFMLIQARRNGKIGWV